MDDMTSFDVCSMFLQVEIIEGGNLVHMESKTVKSKTRELSAADNLSSKKLLLDKKNSHFRWLNRNNGFKKTKIASADASVDVCSIFLKVKLTEGTTQVKTENDHINAYEIIHKKEKKLPRIHGSQKTEDNTTESSAKFADLPFTVKSHICQVCDRHFKKRGGLNEHMLIHTGERPQKCPMCVKSFRLKSNLSRHMLTHTGLKPHFCTICNRKFAQKSDLMVHLSVHTGEKPYLCRICNKSFTQQGSLSRHRQVHTDLRPHECHLCLKRFRKKCSLLNHILIHTNEKPYTCDYCGKTFTQKAGLLSHILRHTGLKPYVCPKCKKGFVTNGILTRHILIHSEIDAQ